MKTPLASLIAAMMFSTVSALAAEITADEVEAMPFVKAWVYAGAIDQFCFVDEKYESDELGEAALAQLELSHMLGDRINLEAAKQTAERHLMGDQSACGPAIAFVEKTVASIPELSPKLEAALAAQKQTKADEAKQEAEARENERVEAMAAKDDCLRKNASDHSKQTICIEALAKQAGMSIGDFLKSLTKAHP